MAGCCHSPGALPAQSLACQPGVFSLPPSEAGTAAMKGHKVKDTTLPISTTSLPERHQGRGQKLLNSITGDLLSLVIRTLSLLSFSVSSFQMAVVPEGAERHPVNPAAASYPQRSFPDSTPVLPHWGISSSQILSPPRTPGIQRARLVSSENPWPHL